MIVLIDGVRYRLVIPDNEAVLEEAIKSNFQHIFGPDSFYLDVKKLIKSKAGIASIPDGYVILFEPKARWCILEVELASHSIYDHIVPQLTKFNRGIENSSSRKKIVEMFYSIINEDEVLKAKLKQQIKTGEIYKFISDLISENPLIVVAIDQRTDELEEALMDIRGEVKAIEFRTFQREGITDQINAYVFEPIVKSKDKSNLVKSETIIKEVSTRRGGIGQSIYELFDEKGIENVTYEECETLAKKIKPDTKFNPSHFSFYKNEYKRKREGRGTDRFGSPFGSKQAKINAVLSNKPKTMKTLVEEAGLSSTYYNHLKSLIEKGFIEKTDKGFKTIFDQKPVSNVPTKAKYSEFWEPIRCEGLFAGKPVPVRDEAWIAKGIKGVTLILQLNNHACFVLLVFKGEDRLERRNKVIDLFPETQYEYKLGESQKSARVSFRVMDKGMKDREHWPEIRENLTKLGADIYNKIKESDI